MNAILNEVIEAYAFEQKPDEVLPYGNGHINDTFLVNCRLKDGQKNYILQHMNQHIFKDPVGMMENIAGVTSWLRKKIEAAGGDPERETLNVLLTKDGKSYYLDSEGEYWRVYSFVDNTTCLEKVEKKEDFYQSGYAFGFFQRQLSDYPAETLRETIPDFHHTPKRYQTFEKVVEKDECKRAAAVQEEIQFVKARKEYMNLLMDLVEEGKIPLRVTHNDTKLNNILIDQATGKAICVIDLDTVMPGLALNDFGDAIRFGASTGAEDERDLSRIWCDEELFEVFAEGFLKGCGDALTQEELHHLTDGAIMMTLECGMRFLTDHLEGDVYFKIHRPGQNLDRARTQFKLVADMEQKKEKLNSIINKIIGQA